jgi:hypothetical protein
MFSTAIIITPKLLHYGGSMHRVNEKGQNAGSALEVLGYDSLSGSFVALLVNFRDWELIDLLLLLSLR